MGIPETILEQLDGAARLETFVGAYDILKEGEYTLVFKFKGSRKANHNLKILSISSDCQLIPFYFQLGWQGNPN